MATDAITKVIIGVPGPPGGGVTAAELAGLMPKTGGTFTGVATFKPSADGTGFVLYEKQDGTDLVVLDTTNGRLKFYGGLDLHGYSDAGTTETWSIDGATGNMQIDGVLTVGGGRIVGDVMQWGFVMDNAGVALTTGVKIEYPVPYAAKITAWEIEADQVGSVVVDIWHDSYSNLPPTVADTITTSEKPTLSGVRKNTDTSLNSGNGWMLTAGSWLAFNIDSITTVTRVTVKLTVVRL
jgi:hypothetical protein